MEKVSFWFTARKHGSMHGDMDVSQNTVSCKTLQLNGEDITDTYYNKSVSDDRYYTKTNSDDTYYTKTNSGTTVLKGY